MDGLMDYNEEDGLPFVIEALAGALPDNGVAIQITYATTAERHAARKWDVAHFAMNAGLAKQFAASLLECSDGMPKGKAPRH